MTQPGTYDEYKSIAELYDHVIPYRDRQDVGFLWKLPESQADRFLRSAAERGGF